MRDADLAADRGDVDDPAAALTLHRRDGRAHRVQRPPEMDVHRVLEISDVHVLERPHLNDAGVVDQDIDRAGARDDLLHELLGLVAVTDVARYDVDVDAARDEVLARALELGAVARGNRHPGALTPELAGDQQSESARSARDEHGAAAKVYGAGRAEA